MKNLAVFALFAQLAQNQGTQRDAFTPYTLDGEPKSTVLASPVLENYQFNTSFSIDATTTQLTTREWKLLVGDCYGVAADQEVTICFNAKYSGFPGPSGLGVANVQLLVNGAIKDSTTFNENGYADFNVKSEDIKLGDVVQFRFEYDGTQPFTVENAKGTLRSTSSAKSCSPVTA